MKLNYVQHLLFILCNRNISGDQSEEWDGLSERRHKHSTKVGYEKKHNADYCLSSSILLTILYFTLIAFRYLTSFIMIIYILRRGWGGRTFGSRRWWFLFTIRFTMAGWWLIIHHHACGWLTIRWCTEINNIIKVIQCIRGKWIGTLGAAGVVGCKGLMKMMIRKWLRWWKLAVTKKWGGFQCS